MGLQNKPDINKLTAKGNVKKLINALGFEKGQRKDYIVREMAAIALGNIGDPRAVKPLFTALKDSDGGVRYRAAEALWKIGMQQKGYEFNGEDIDQLITALKDETYNVREYVARILGELNDSRAVKPLCTTLCDDKKTVRKYAAEALGKIGDPSAVKPLHTTLRDIDKDVREYSATALDKLDWRPDSTEIEVAYWIAKKDLNKCVEIGTPTVEPLIALINIKEERLSYDVGRALKKIGAPAVEPLIKALDKEKDIRLDFTFTVVVSTLGEIGDQRAVEPLINHLHRNPESVIKALGKIGDQRAIEGLIPLLNGRWRDEAAKALDQLGWHPEKNDEYEIAYRIGLRHWDACVKIGAPAVEQLIAFCDELTLLKGERGKALSTLGRIGDPKAVDFLIAYSQRTDVAYDYKMEALKALKKITGQDFGDNTDK